MSGRPLFERSLADYIETTENHPEPGVTFRDVTPICRDPQGMAQFLYESQKLLERVGVDLIAGFDARGFIFGAPLAVALRVGFIPVRKADKLPPPVFRLVGRTEYSDITLEIKFRDVKPGQRVLLVDDVLATGGTMEIGCRLIKNAGGIVAGCLVVAEIRALKGRDRLSGYKVLSLVEY